MITVSGLTKSYGARVLFRDVTFQLSDGRRIALVGGNGAGKTTLLEIVLGTTEADGGEVHRPKDLTVGYLPQEITEWRDGSVLDEVLAGRPEVQELEQRLARLHDDLATTSGGRARPGAGRVRRGAEPLRGARGLRRRGRRPPGAGRAGLRAGRRGAPAHRHVRGWRMRAALGRLLLAQPDVLILDEPTNHLDTDSVTWLEDTLSSYAGAVLFVSHDRDFIDAVAERVIELAAGTATEYVGGFAEFVVQREERLARLRVPRRPPGAGHRPRRALRRAVPLQGDEGPPGPEPHQDAREAGPHRGARPPRPGRPLRLPAAAAVVAASWPSWSTSPSATTAWPS